MGRWADGPRDPRRNPKARGKLAVGSSSCSSVVPFDRGNVRFRPTIGPHAIEGSGERDRRERATLRTFVVPQPEHQLLQRLEHLGRLALFRHDAHVVAPTRRPVVSGTKKKNPTKVPIGPRDAKCGR